MLCHRIVVSLTRAACLALARFNVEQTRMALSYAVQHAAGNRCWIRDPAHVKKAFVFGGLPASSGVRAALMAGASFTGVADPIEGTPGLAAAFRETSQAELAIRDLGERWETRRTILKKWSVGMPIQSALDSIERAIEEHDLTKPDIDAIVVTLPEERVQVVDSAMPDINLPHLLGLYLVDGGVTFDTIHDHTRMQDLEVRRVAAKVAVLPRAGAGRRDLAHLTIESGGKRFSYRPDHARGEPQEPLSPTEIATKAAGLMEPVLGAGRTEALLGALSGDGPVRALRSLWCP